jgi:nucleotide-binding universal stress UspA family protein
VTHVTAVLERDDELRPVSVDRQVVAAAEALARLLGVGTLRLHVPPGPEPDRAAVVLEALADEDVAGAAMSAKGPEPICWDVITQVATPVIVMPRNSKPMTRGVSRVLLPMDGTPATAAGVADMARHALDSGATVLGVHVFDSGNIPAFWDQAAHTHQEWTREFARRHLPEAVELDLRTGRPAEEVLAHAEQDGVDLIVIGWGQDLSVGRAATVRHALTHGHVPVVLVPIGVEDLSRS